MSLKKIVLTLFVLKEIIFPKIIAYESLPLPIHSFNSNSEKYAVLIGAKGNIFHPFKQNLKDVYGVLLNCGFKEENIHSFYEENQPSKNYIKHKTSIEDIKKLFNNLSYKIDHDDILFLLITGHGNKKRDEPFIRFEESKLLPSDLTSYLKDINPSLGLLIFDPCCGAYFAKETGKGNYISISQSSEEDPYSILNTFPKLLFESLNKGKSIGESFKYAKKNDIISLLRLQHPQIYTSLNPDTVFLNY